MNFLTRAQSFSRITTRFVEPFLSLRIIINYLTFRIVGANCRNFCTPKPDAATNRKLNEPIRYVGSPAASMFARQARAGAVNYDDIPWYQIPIVCGSLAIFLIYFCVLREENDVDLELEKSLFDRVPGLEATQLVLRFKYNIEHNIDNSEIIKRMVEVGV